MIAQAHCCFAADELPSVFLTPSVIQYSGNVVTTGCTVSVANNGGLNFSLGDVDINALANIGDATPWVRQSLLFSNCETGARLELKSLTTDTSISDDGDIAAYVNNYQTDNLAIQAATEIDNNIIKLSDSTPTTLVPNAESFALNVYTRLQHVRIKLNTLNDYYIPSATETINGHVITSGVISGYQALLIDYK